MYYTIIPYDDIIGVSCMQIACHVFQMVLKQKFTSFSYLVLDQGSPTVDRGAISSSREGFQVARRSSTFKTLQRITSSLFQTPLKSVRLCIDSLLKKWPATLSVTILSLSVFCSFRPLLVNLIWARWNVQIKVTFFLAFSHSRVGLLT